MQFCSCYTSGSFSFYSSMRIGIFCSGRLVCNALSAILRCLDKYNTYLECSSTGHAGRDFQISKKIPRRSTGQLLICPLFEPCRQYFTAAVNFIHLCAKKPHFGWDSYSAVIQNSVARVEDVAVFDVSMSDTELSYGIGCQLKVA